MAVLSYALGWQFRRPKALAGYSMKVLTRVVDTTQLQIGDVVLCHGGRFELVSFTCDAARAAELAEYTRKWKGEYYNAGRVAEVEREAVRQESLRAFATRYLGREHPDYACAVPLHSRDCEENPNGWTIQGNALARWTIEVTA
jgi:hypothetical protein